MSDIEEDISSGHDDDGGSFGDTDAYGAESFAALSGSAGSAPEVKASGPKSAAAHWDGIGSDEATDAGAAAESTRGAQDGLDASLQTLLESGVTLLLELEAAGLADPLVGSLLQGRSSLSQALRQIANPFSAAGAADDRASDGGGDDAQLLNTNEHLRVLLEDGAQLLAHLEEAGLSLELVETLLTGRSSLAQRLLLEAAKTSPPVFELHAPQGTGRIAQPEPAQVEPGDGPKTQDIRSRQVAEDLHQVHEPECRGEPTRDEGPAAPAGAAAQDTAAQPSPSAADPDPDPDPGEPPAGDEAKELPRPYHGPDAAGEEPVALAHATAEEACAQPADSAAAAAAPSLEATACGEAAASGPPVAGSAAAVPERTHAAQWLPAKRAQPAVAAAAAESSSRGEAPARTSQLHAVGRTPRAQSAAKACDRLPPHDHSASATVAHSVGAEAEAGEREAVENQAALGTSSAGKQLEAIARGQSLQFGSACVHNAQLPQLAQEVWVQLSYSQEGARDLGVRDQQRLADVIALVGGVRPQAVQVMSRHARVCASTRGCFHVAVRVRIDDEQWEEAWSRTSRATKQIAARLECLEVSLNAQEATWEHEGSGASPEAARQEDALHHVGSDVDVRLVPADAGAEGACARAGGELMPLQLVKKGYLHVLQRRVRENGGGAEEEQGENGEALGAGLEWRRAWFELWSQPQPEGPSLPQLHMCRAPGSSLPLASFSLAHAQLGSLPGCDKGLVLRLAPTARQLRLKAANFADFAAWLVALRAVPGVIATEFTPLSLEPRAAEATANDERDASRSRALAQGLAGLSGAMRDAVEPVASAAAEMAKAQHELRLFLASLHEQYSVLTAEMAMARHLACEERTASLQVLGMARAGGPGHAPSQPAREHGALGGEVAGGQCGLGTDAGRAESEQQAGSAALSLRSSGRSPSKVHQPRGDTCAEDVEPSRRARVSPPAEEDPEAVVEGEERGAHIETRLETHIETHIETRLSNFAALGVLDQEAKGCGGDVPLQRLRSCIAAVQAEFGYQKTDMPALAHVRQAGFAAEALSVTYAFGGRTALAARLGLEVVPEDVVCSRFAEWDVVQKAVMRAAKALAVQEQRQLIARREVGGKSRRTHATRPDAQTLDAVCQPVVAPGGVGQGKRTLCMPSASQLRAQGMQQVDRAIRELHGGYAAVALKLGLHPPKTQLERRNRSPERANRPSRPSSASRPGLSDAAGAAEAHGQGVTVCRTGTIVKGTAPAPLWGGKAYQSSIPPKNDPRFYEDFKNLRLTIEELVRQQSTGAVSTKTAMRHMPTERQLEEHGLHDALFAIKLRHGGIHQVARKLGLRIQGPGARAERARA